MGWQRGGAGKFSNAKGLAVDKAGNVYAADTDNHRVQMFSATGAFQADMGRWSGLTVPDVAVGPGGEVWATTGTNTTVVQLGGGGEITTPKSADGVAIDAAGNVYVSTAGDNIRAVVAVRQGGVVTPPAKTPWRNPGSGGRRGVARTGRSTSPTGGAPRRASSASTRTASC